MPAVPAAVEAALRQSLSCDFVPAELVAVSCVSRSRLPSTVCLATADGHGSGVPRKTSRTTIGLHGWPRVARKHLWLGLRSILRIYCRAEVVVPHPWRRSSDPRSALSFSSEAETQMLHLHLLHVSQAGHLLQHYVLGGPFF